MVCIQHLDERGQMLEGYIVVSEERGFKLESTTLDDLGTCKKVVSDKDNRTIVGGGGTSETISSRVND